MTLRVYMLAGEGIAFGEGPVNWTAAGIGMGWKLAKERGPLFWRRAPWHDEFAYWANFEVVGDPFRPCHFDAAFEYDERGRCVHCGERVT